MEGGHRTARPAHEAQARVLVAAFWTAGLIGIAAWASGVGVAVHGSLLPTAIAVFLGLGAWVLVSRSATSRFAPVLVVVAVLAGNALVFCVEDPALRAAGAGWNVILVLVFADLVSRRVLVVCVAACVALAAVLVADLPGPAVLRLLRGVAVAGLVGFPLLHLLGLRLRLNGVVEAAEERARRDSLTGLLNRRGLRERFPALCWAAQREERAVAALSLDLDHFKRVNDTFGHAGGDAALVAAARALVAATRGEDLAVRLGGEELVVLLSTGSPQEAAVTAERLRRAVARACDAWSLTASVGVAVLRVPHDRPASPPTSVDDQCVQALLEELLRDADRRLYLAKAQGRDRVVSGP